MIKTVKSVENPHEIISADGFRSVFIGSVDFAIQIGCYDEVDSIDVTRSLDRIETAVLDGGVLIGWGKIGHSSVEPIAKINR